MVAKTGMASVNYDPNNGYVEHFMFGGRIELHSVLGDLWAHYGLLGIALTGYVAFLLVRGMSVAISTRRGVGVVIFLCCWTLWNLLFSPFYGSALTLVLALGLALTEKSAVYPAVPLRVDGPQR